MPSSADATWIPCIIDGMIYPFSQELENPDMVLKFKKPAYKGLSIEEYTKAAKEAESKMK